MYRNELQLEIEFVTKKKLKRYCQTEKKTIVFCLPIALIHDQL